MNTVDLRSFDLSLNDREAIALALPMISYAGDLHDTDAQYKRAVGTAKIIMSRIEHGTNLFTLAEFGIIVLAVDLARNAMLDCAIYDVAPEYLSALQKYRFQYGRLVAVLQTDHK